MVHPSAKGRCPAVAQVVVISDDERARAAVEQHLAIRGDAWVRFSSDTTPSKDGSQECRSPGGHPRSRRRPVS